MTTNEMIERVAKAMATVIAKRHNHRPEDWIEEAKAAIAAMREPTLSMMKATNVGEERSKRYWQDMIDAALDKEEIGEVDENY